MGHTVQCEFERVCSEALKSDEPEFQIERVKSIREVCAQEWDLAAGSNPMSSFGWLVSSVESRRQDVERFYLVARDAEGVAGAFECCFEAPGDAAATLDRAIFGNLARMANAVSLSCLPAVVVQKRILRRALSSLREMKLLAQLVDEVEREATSRCAAVGFRQIEENSEFALRAVLTQRSYCESIDLPYAQMDLSPDWRTFADYQKHLKQTHAATESSIRQELNRGKKCLLEIRKVDDTVLDQEIYGLLRDHYVRLNGRPFQFDDGFLPKLRDSLGERLVLAVARIEGELVAASLGIRLGEAIAFPMIGVNLEAGKKAAAYFNLGYNFNIQQVIGMGVRVIHFGTLVYDTKVRRGCRLEPTALFLRLGNGFGQAIARQLLKLRSKRVREKFELDRLFVEARQNRI